VHAPRWPANHRAAKRPPPEFAAAPPQSARAPLPYRRCTDEYGGIEYGGLPVNYSVSVITLYINIFRRIAYFAPATLTRNMLQCWHIIAGIFAV
jgi:hypothetical protein